LRNALRRVLDNADWDDLADLANAMTGQRDVNTHEMADALLAAPPQEQVSEAMVEAGLKAKDGYAVFGAVYGVGEREVMRRILTAAMSAGRADV
jgi:hypothetical protein